MFKWGVLLGVLFYATMGHAVIGQGILDVASRTDLDNVQRDVNRASVVVKDETLGGLDADATVNTRWITGTTYTQKGPNGVAETRKTSGLAELSNDLKSIGQMGYTKDSGLGGNLEKAYYRGSDAARDLSVSVQQGLQGQNARKDYQRSTDFRQATLEFQQEHPELASILNNNSLKGSSQYQEALGAYNNYVQSHIGGQEIRTRIYDSNRLTKRSDANGNSLNGRGLTDMDTRDIYFNTAQTNFSDPNQLIGVAGHENIHATGERSEAIADRGREQAQNAWRSENRYNNNQTGGGYTSHQQFYDRNHDSLSVVSGTNDVRGVRDAQPDAVIWHGGGGGAAEGMNGAQEMLKTSLNYKHVYAPEFRHNGIFQTSPDHATTLIQNYKHKDTTHTQVWGHSMGADAAAQAYGTNPNSPNAPEHVQELNLVMPRVEYVMNNLDNMSKNADQVNVFLLGGDKIWGTKSYGDRSFETMKNNIQSSSIPKNVKVIKIDNFFGISSHGGALNKNSPVFNQIWGQYKAGKSP